MSKKVLIVENSLAVRNIAESLLRQNGYEVIPADGSAPAREILKSSRLELILCSSEIREPDGQYFYETLGSDSSTASLPLLILHDPAAGELAFPPEAIINKPFTPREFLDKVGAFTGVTPTATTTTETSLAGTSAEDELIDQALGLDQLEVDQAEVIGNDTGTFRVLNKKISKESMMGFEFKAQKDDTITEKKGKPVEQINVPVDQEQTQKKPPAEQEFLGHDSQKMATERSADLSESSKIEIATDQYGMINPKDLRGPDNPEDGGTHDYNWFINEMQKEVTGQVADDSGSLKFEKTSQGLEPSAPTPTSDLRPEQSTQEGGQHHGQAIDKFISEFKKEMEKISDETATDINEIPVTKVAPDKKISDQKNTQLRWEEAVEKVTPAEMRLISKELVNAIAQNIVTRIMSQINPDMVYHIVRECIHEALEKTFKTRSGQLQ